MVIPLTLVMLSVPAAMACYFATQEIPNLTLAGIGFALRWVAISTLVAGVWITVPASLWYYNNRAGSTGLTTRVIETAGAVDWLWAAVAGEGGPREDRRKPARTWSFLSKSRFHSPFDKN
ncbi:hypothetical protein DFH08DRAFT_811668 [Mycena albidolilacea]|uniref:Uncharacterized protein n=1 Tax=Mycena albidolilacea TaxID=1033008 RepID=A0AAD7EN47_9AGAR|nr:hypothetical protein DFH08DRAFT_811668 [Mycena albidolilacea]